MAIRRINFTKRRRIVRDDVDIVLYENVSPPRFDAHLTLDGYRFPGDARVFIETYRQTALARFDCGTVGTLNQPTGAPLENFESAAAVLFRVRVTSKSSKRGLLLGLADQIRARSPDEKPDNRVPLLPPMPDDLGDELWRVDFGSGRPYLVVNNRLRDWKETLREPYFRAAVFPAAMRLILQRILYVEEITTTDDDQDWCSRWLRFASALTGLGPVPSERAEYDDWVEDAVAAFARRARLWTSVEAIGGVE